MKTLRFILGDQLNHNHSWFQTTDENVIYLMAEMRQETDYVKHHIQKVVAFFLSMRNFASHLKSKKHQLVYFEIDDAKNPQHLEKLILKTIESYSIEKFEYLLPDEFRLDEQLKQICQNLPVPTEAFNTEHFYTTRTELTDFFQGKKLLLMENFYRMMRKKHNVLMIGANPVGNQWNFDHDNRKKYKGEVPIPKAKIFPKNVKEIIHQLEKMEVNTFGSIDAENFNWSTSREECLEQLDYFCQHLLKHFGDYEDAMHVEEKFLFHSRLSFAMN